MEQEIAFKLQAAGINHQTQIQIPITTADFYIQTESGPLIAFIDGPVHIKTAQMIKDEKLGDLPRRRTQTIRTTNPKHTILPEPSSIHSSNL